jgi:hypothetical protein
MTDEHRKTLDNLLESLEDGLVNHLDGPFPDEWHTADEREMWAEGWILDYADRPYCGPSAIFATTEETRLRDSPIRFASDDEARAFVQQRAAEGASYALKAVRIVAAGFST